MALLRLLTNRAVTGEDVLTRRRACEVVDKLLADSRVRMLSEPEGLDKLWMAFSKRDDHSHVRWTDDYLAAVAGAKWNQIRYARRGLRVALSLG